MPDLSRQSNPLTKQARNVNIANDALSGKAYDDIAAAYGISQRQIYRILNDDEIKDVIETGTKELITQVPKAVDNYRVMLADPEHAAHYKASKDMLQAVGILPTHTVNQFITNIYNQNNTIFSQTVMEVIDKHESKSVLDVDLGLDSVSGSGD